MVRFLLLRKGPEAKESLDIFDLPYQFLPFLLIKVNIAVLSGTIMVKSLVTF